MISFDCIYVRYGELNTKGKNIVEFKKLLYQNIRHALREFDSLTYIFRRDHIFIELNGTDYEPVVEILKGVSGIYSFSLIIKSANQDLDYIKKTCFEALINEKKHDTYKIECKRNDKSYQPDSRGIIKEVASYIHHSDSSIKVDVHNPDVLLNILIGYGETLIYTNSILGAGGYPLGIGGKAMHMLSGGIDSPVAAYLMMKRGVKVECIHFASPPYTNIGVIYKLEDILHQLTRYQPSIKLHIVPFTKIQEAIYENCPESYCITIMRRMMYRLASALAKRKKCPVISNGESIGQVASQTLDSMATINEVTNTPIIRPCAVLDKVEIIDMSKKIKTYDISIRPYEDCCTIFTPKAPKTKPKLGPVEELEARFDYASLIEEALNNIDTRVYTDEDENDII